MIPVNYIEISGQKIAYYQSLGVGANVLFIHGNSCSGLTFRKQLIGQLGEKFRLIAIDLPGHGNSDQALEKSQYSLPGYARIISEVVTSLNLKSLILVGWSLGGHIALQAAPIIEALRGIVIYGTPPLDLPLEIEGKFFSNKLIEYAFTSQLSKKQATDFAKLFFSPNSNDDINPFITDILKTDGNARVGLGDCINSSNYLNEVEIVNNLEIPLGIFHGKSEQLVDYENFKKLTIPKLWRNSCQIIDEGGHALHWQKADVFNQFLDEFVNDVLF